MYVDLGLVNSLKIAQLLWLLSGAWSFTFSRLFSYSFLFFMISFEPNWIYSKNKTACISCYFSRINQSSLARNQTLLVSIYLKSRTHCLKKLVVNLPMSLLAPPQQQWGYLTGVGRPNERWTNCKTVLNCVGRTMQWSAAYVSLWVEISCSAWAWVGFLYVLPLSLTVHRPAGWVSWESNCLSLWGWAWMVVFFLSVLRYADDLSKVHITSVSPAYSICNVLQCIWGTETEYTDANIPLLS